MDSDSKERVKKFNTQLKEFLLQLNKSKKIENNELEILLTSEVDYNDKLINEFYEICKDNQELILQKNNSLFNKENFIWGLDLNLYLKYYNNYF